MKFYSAYFCSSIRLVLMICFDLYAQNVYNDCIFLVGKSVFHPPSISSINFLQKHLFLCSCPGLVSFCLPDIVIK